MKGRRGPLFLLCPSIQLRLFDQVLQRDLGPPHSARQHLPVELTTHDTTHRPVPGKGRVSEYAIVVVSHECAKLLTPPCGSAASAPEVPC